MKFLRISYEFHVNLTKRRHFVHGDGRILRYNAPLSIGFVPDTMGRDDGARPKEPFHLVADCTRRRCLQDLQQGVTKALAAPYIVKYFPDAGQIVLTPETRVVRAIQPDPSMEERLVTAVWWIWPLHLSRTEARYLVGA